MSRKVNSMGFGTWLRSARRDARKSQQAAATEAGIDQQLWSRLERGLAPRDCNLEAICKAVSRTTTEASSIIEADALSVLAVQEYQTKYKSYKTGLLAREKSRGEVGVFILREDAEPVDSIAVDEYIDILKGTSQTWINLLFRSPDPRVWRSFYQLHGSIIKKLGGQEGGFIQRLRGYYRHDEYAEPAVTSLPITHPYILGSDGGGVSLTVALFDQSVRRNEILTGCSEAEAAQRSLCMMEQSQNAAMQIRQWIGLRNAIEPLTQLWVPITN